MWLIASLKRIVKKVLQELSSNSSHWCDHNCENVTKYNYSKWCIGEGWKHEFYKTCLFQLCGGRGFKWVPHNLVDSE